jgi:hypothetical protein
MPSTLTHGARLRRPLERAAAVLAVAAVVMTTACRDDGPRLPDELSVLGPTEPGTYRIVGTERDSRTGRSTATSESYTVEPWFSRDGVDHQITRFEEPSGDTGHWETAFRSSGAHRLRESRNGASWEWDPPVPTLALPLSVGRSWAYESTATVPDVAGVRRVTTVSARWEVAGTDTVVVGGRRVDVFLLDSAVTTLVTDTKRVDRSVTTVSLTSEGRSEFSPEHMLVVRNTVSTTVRGDVADAPYELTRRTELERLTPSAPGAR